MTGTWRRRSSASTRGGSSPTTSMPNRRACRRAVSRAPPGRTWPEPVLVISAARFGGPEVLAGVQAADPIAGPGELVVAATASDVLFVDTMIRSGRGVGFFPIRPPYVPGNGVAGEVISVGDGVDDGWLGRAVIAQP